MKSKRIPLRMCMGCCEMKPKKDLIRITKIQGKEKKGLIIDPSGKSLGRGAYVCKNIECVEILKKSLRLEKLFSQKISESFYEELEGVIS